MSDEATPTTCTYTCPTCGEHCCTESGSGESGLCFLHDLNLTPEQREEQARATGAASLKEHLEAKVAEGQSLHGVRLSGAELPGARLNRADLRGATCNEANLSRARLYEADLREANFYNANLRYAGLWKSNLTGTCLDWADMRGTRGLTPEDCREIKPTVSGFRSVKRMFSESHRPDEAGEVAFWEKQQFRRDLGKQCRDWRTRLRWLVLVTVEAVCGHFERPVRTVICSTLVILFCGAIFAAGSGIERVAMDRSDPEAHAPTTLSQGVYFSLVTFTTVGYGDFRPKPGIWRLIATLEAVSGAFLMAVFVVTLAHRYVVR